MPRFSHETIRAAVDNIERGAGHTTRCVRAAIATSATLIVAGNVEDFRKLRDWPGLRVASFDDLAAGRVHGPLIIDPNVLQAIHGYPALDRERAADRRWTTPEPA